MTEIEAEKMFDWLCRRWVNNRANINVELNVRDLRFTCFEHEKCYVPTVVVNMFSLHNRLTFMKETGEPISTKHMDIKEFIKNLFKAAKSSSIHIGGFTRPFVSKNESYEEILVKIDLESI